MRCQGCNKKYQSTIPGIMYFDIWIKSICIICKEEGSSCSLQCSLNNICKSCKRSINLEKILK